MEVVDSEGNSVFNTEHVLEKWKSDYSNLLNSGNIEKFDIQQHDHLLQNGTINNEQLNLDSLNMDITYQEVRDSVYRAKLRKASGFDGIPSEILRFDICIELLYKIFPPVLGMVKYQQNGQKGLYIQYRSRTQKIREIL